MDELDGIDHVALAVQDVGRSVTWYEQGLGLGRRHEDIWGDFPAVVGVGTTAIALFPVEGKDPKQTPGRETLAMRHVAFRASRACFDAFCRRLKTQSIAFEFQNHEIAHSIYLNDPDGHEIEITTYEL
ncbi:MAG: VOC family protein [Candidatus Latescibacteria bacterium]|nr:VOC family protein [Candidatus Latescibacterota bacterium]